LLPLNKGNEIHEFGEVATCGQFVKWEGCSDGAHNVIIGDMLEMGVIVTAKGADWGFRRCVIIQECDDVGCECFHWAAWAGDGMVSNDLALAAVFLIINMEAYEIWQGWIGLEGIKGKWLVLVEECDILELELLCLHGLSGMVGGVFVHLE